MNYFKKFLGYSTNELNQLMQNTKINGTLFRVIKDTRNIIFKHCQICFIQEGNDKKFMMLFNDKSKVSQEETQEYAFPVHLGMKSVSFSMNKVGKTYACFEWTLDEDSEHIGCYMDPKDKQKFKEILCQILKLLANDENIKDHLSFCKQLQGIPIYKQNQNIKRSQLEIQNKELLNDLLLKQANKKQTKMVHTASVYQYINKQRKILKLNIIFVIKQINKFQYEFQLINQTNFIFLRKKINSGLVYQINVDGGYIKWLDVNNNKIIQVNLDGQRDAALSLQYNIMQCLYEINSQKKITDAIDKDQLHYIKRIAQMNNNDLNKQIVKKYQNSIEIEINQPKFIYNNKQVQKGLDKYHNFYQSKINNMQIAGLGSMLEILKINDNNQIKYIEGNRLFNQKNIQVNISQIILHDYDSKALIKGLDQQLYYQDLNKGKLIQQWNPSPKGVKALCPEYKLADTKQFKTFKVISDNSIMQIDPRTEQAVVNKKTYSTNPKFNTLAVDSQGRYATGCETGQIRLYKTIGKKACNKYRMQGDAVLHLQSTKDGKWLLATFAKELILLPTSTQDEQSMYQQQIPYIKRPIPIKLKLKLDHLSLLKLDENFKFIPAKFDQNNNENNHQKFIISGVGNYVLIWSMSKILHNNLQYKFCKLDQSIIQADFQFNNTNKIIMMTQKGIIIKENKIKK